ncbi:MAG: hypothetical protein ACR2MQ_14895 [Gemmatimonadaceae bacterium]
MLRADDAGLIRKEWLWFAALVTTVYCVWGALVQSGQFERHVDLLTAAAAVDLLGVVTLAYWLLVVRRGIASTRTILTVFAMSLLGARLLLPASAVSRLELMRLAMAPVEIGSVCAAIIPNALAARFTASELATTAYAFIPAPLPRDGENHTTFTVAPLLGKPMMWALIGLVLVETIPVHLLIEHWSVRVAWVVTGLTVYSAILIVGHVRSVTIRRCELLSDSLVLRVGLRCDAALPLTEIESVKPLAWRDAATLAPSVMNAAKPQSANVIVTLKRPLRVAGIIATKRTVSQIALRLATPHGMIAAVNSCLASGR